MMVGFLAASRYGRRMSSFAIVVWGVVVKTLGLDRDHRGRQYGHVFIRPCYRRRGEKGVRTIFGIVVLEKGVEVVWHW
jgi:hypothetical protein